MGIEVIERRPYRHFKGKLYYVHAVTEHTETREIYVSYQALYPPYGMYLRTLPDFMAEIDVNREGNITHQSRRFELYDGNMDIAKLEDKTTLPLEQPSLLNEKSRCIGVDGCRGGWIAAVIDNGRLKIEKYTAIGDITEQYPSFDEFLLDMPIGLPSSKTDIRPDDIARKLLGKRSSTIFNVPCRQAVYAGSVSEMYDVYKETMGKGLQPLTKAIIPKIREVDEFLCGHVQYKNKIKESHPEVGFAGLNGSVVMSKKSTAEGLTERLQILRKYLPELSETEIKDKARAFTCNEDDIVDAICLAVVANLSVQGKTAAVPENPSEDVSGLKMQLIVPKNLL